MGKFVIFFISLYLIPFIIAMKYFYAHPASDFIWQSAMSAFLSAFLVYFVGYLIRDIIFITVALISLFNKDKFINIINNNSIILISLIIFDFLIYKILLFNKVCMVNNLRNAEDAIIYILLFTLSIAYFPIWVIYGVHNLVCVMKKLRIKLSK